MQGHQISRIAGLAVALLLTLARSAGAASDPGSYQSLLGLFQEWRTFQQPPLRAGAPDYTAATMAGKQAGLPAMQARLAAIDPSRWPMAQQVDYRLLRAEMNGYDFDLRVLEPWVRDPAFYQSIWPEQSDTPSHESPTNAAVIDLWTYHFPLSPAEEQRLARELAVIPPFLEQARANLTGNAHDLWVTGTGTMRGPARGPQGAGREDRARGRGAPEGGRSGHAARPPASSPGSRRSRRPKTGPSGVGKDNYTWSQQNVHLVPLTWDDEVALLKRELARAHASLVLEEQRNRGLPQLKAVASADAEYQRRADPPITKYVAFLGDREILTVEPYLDTAMQRQHRQLRARGTSRTSSRSPTHYEPMTLYAHFSHWLDHALDGARAQRRARSVRSALLYNIWDTRSEGMATAMEELICTPATTTTIRARARSSGSCSPSAARAGSPRSTRRPMSSTSRRPRPSRPSGRRAAGCGSTSTWSASSSSSTCASRATAPATSRAKYMIDEVIKDRAHQLGKDFTLRRFFDELNGAGLIPVSLIHLQLTGQPLTTPDARP